jgi:hypothetical protein
MLKKVIVFGFISLLPIWCYSQSLLKISKSIYESEEKSGCRELTFKARNKFFKTSQARLFKKQPDTLYIIEGYDIEQSGVVTTIWNKTTVISYQYYFRKFSITDEVLLPISWIKMITRFDKNEIEKFNEKTIDGLNYTAIRVIVKDKEIVLDKIKYKDKNNRQ